MAWWTASRFHGATAAAAAGGLIVLALAPGAGPAKAAGQPLTCLLASGQTQVQGVPGQPSGPPLILFATATNSNRTTANNNAINGWSQQAAARGGAYANWNKALHQDLACNPSKSGFQWVYTCSARAQPCK